jgi:hypothetical protein
MKHEILFHLNLSPFFCTVRLTFNVYDSSTSLRSYIVCPTPRLTVIFLVWSFFKEIWEMNLSETYFQVLSLSNYINQVGVTHKGVASCALSWLTFTWSLGVTSIWSVPPHLSISKMSHAILNGVTLVWVAPPLLVWLILSQNQSVYFPYRLSFFYN